MTIVPLMFGRLFEVVVEVVDVVEVDVPVDVEVDGRMATVIL